MKKKIKEYLIPSKENEYKPRFFHSASALAIAVLILFAFLASSIQRELITSTHLSAVISSVLVDLTNDDRASHQLSQLASNAKLKAAAQRKANDMAEKGYFAHESPEGLKPWHWFREADYAFTHAGENLAVHFSDSANVEEAWMDSPAHRANILNDSFTEIGIATAQGTYQGRQTTFVVQMFGTPASEPQVSGEASPQEEQGTQAPAVAGTPPQEETAQEETEVIAEDDMFIAVKNAQMAPPAQTAGASNYATWYEELLASPQTTLKYIYTGIAAIVVLALLLMVFVEIRRQHTFHIILAISLLALMVALLYVARTFIFPAVLIS